MHKTRTRILSMVLAICTMLSLLPTTVFAAFGEGKHSTGYDEAVIEVLTEATGSEESAIELLDRLYSAGMVDESGHYLENPTFVVDGETVTAEALLEMAEQHNADDEVTVDGETTTWGTLSEYISAAKDLAALMELQDSDVQLTEEHLETLRSLLENLETGISVDAEYQLAELSEHKTWPETAEKEIELNTLTDDTTGRKYIEEPGFGGSSESGYSESYPFYLASQNSTAAYTDSRYDGSGISHSARVSLSYSTGSVAAQVKTEETDNDQTITVTASLTIAQPVAVSFDYRAVAGSWSAVEGSGTVTWEAGETGKKTFDITVKGTEKNSYKGYRCFIIQCYNIKNALFTEGKSVVDKQINVTCSATMVAPSGTVTKKSLIKDIQDKDGSWGGNDEKSVNKTYTIKLPAVDESKWDMKVTWTLYLKYTLRNVSAQVNAGNISQGYTNLKFECAPIGLNYTQVSTYYQNSGEIVVNGNVVSGSAYGKDLNEAEITVTLSAHSAKHKNDMGYDAYSLFAFKSTWGDWDDSGNFNYNTIKFSYSDTISEVSVENVSIPDGKFYPGQQVPITVTYDYPFYSEPSNSPSITVNGDILTPAEVGSEYSANTAAQKAKRVLSNTYTYLYTVKELDSGTVGISSFNFGSEQKGLNYAAAKKNYLKLKNQDYSKIPGISNTNCMLQTPAKVDSFSAFQVGCDDADPAQQTTIVNLPIKDTQDEQGNYPYIAWIAANQAYDSTGTTVKLGDGTEKEVHFYVKSMYVSNDGGVTRYPLWIVTEDGEITLTKPDGTEYKASEFPTNLVANMAPATNSTADFRVDTVELFVDPEIDSAVDYLVHEKNTRDSDESGNVYYTAGDDAPAASVAINYAFPVYVKGVVMLENSYVYTEGGETKNDGQDVSISYSEEWLKGYEVSALTADIKGKATPKATDEVDMTRKVYEYYVQNEQDMILEYVIHDRYNEGNDGKQAEEYYGHGDFTFQSYEWMKWESSDESIATVDETGYVTFTGKTGDVYFILTALNGGNESVQFCLYSDVVRVKAGMTPFMQINKANRDKVAQEDTDIAIYFTSNIAERNQAENGEDYQTTITARMYEMSAVDYDGNTVKVGTAVPVWTGSVTSPVANKVYSTKTDYETEYVPKNSIIVPGEYVKKVAAGSDKDYVVVVSADFCKADGTTSEVSAFATLQVKPSPAKPKLGKLNGTTGEIEKLDSYSVLSSAIPNISYQVKNAKDGMQVYYTVKDSSSTDFTSELLTSSSGTIDTGEFTASGGLKNIYTISLYARNSEEDAWTVDSMTLNVYNADALQLVVTAAKSLTLGGSTGGQADSGENLVKDGKVSFERLSLVKKLLNGNERQINIDGKEITLEMLRNDISLQYIVSINYGDYAWGMLSDQIEWASSDHTVASLNYYQGGYYSDIESYSYPSYLPATDLVGMGLKEGTTTFTATHVQNGMTRSVEVDVTRLENQFYLFQFQPKTTTTVTYTNGEGKEIKLKTNDQGQLAVYEPSGIQSDVLATGDVGEKTYAGVIEQEDLISGEQDLTNLVTYPLNNLKMRLVSEVYIYVKKPDGTPAANMDVTLRGGVYKNNLYCPDAKFGTTASDFVVNQNGREDFVGKTDSTGKLTVKMDTTQFLTAEDDIPMIPGDVITYIYELRVGDGKTYAPDLIKVTSVTGDDLESGFATSATYQLQSFDASAQTPVLVHQYFQMYSTAVNPETKETYLSPVSYADDVISETGKIGPSLKYHTAVLDSVIMYWANTVTAHDSNGYALLPDTISSKDRVVLKNMDNEELPGQISVSNRKEAITDLNDCSGLGDLSMYVYPFSSMTIGRSAFKMDSDSFDYNSTTQDYDYLPQYESMNIQMDIISGGKTVSNAVMPFSIINMLGAADPQDSIEAMISQVRKQLAQNDSVGDMISNITDVVNPVLELPFRLISDVMFDSGLSQMYARIYPSNDPTVYRILIADIFEGDEVAFDNSSKVDNVSEVIEKKQAKEKENADIWYNKVLSGYNKDRQSFGYAMEGYQILEAKCDKYGNWTIRPVAGHVFAQLPDITILSWTEDFLVGPVPCFVSFGIGFGLNMGYDFMERNGTIDRLVKNTLRVYFDIGGGLGSGSFADVITLKLGLFFKMGLNIEFLRLLSENIYPEKTDYFGTGLIFNGEFSIRFEVGVGPLTYTHNFLRVGYALPAIGISYYDAIVAYNKSGDPNDFKALSGYTLQGDEYQIMGADEDGLLIDITTARVDDRNYLERGNRAWYDDSQDMSLQELYGDEENYAKLLQTNAYPKAYPVYTDDGKGMFYLTDLNVGSDPISAVAFADRSSGSTEDKGAIEEYHFYVRKDRAYYAKNLAGVYKLAGKTEANSEIELVEYNAADNYILFRFADGEDTKTVFKMDEVAGVGLNKMYVKVVADTERGAYQQGSEIDAMNYNASALVASGSGKDYFAAWVRQTESLKKEMGASATDDDLSLSLNAGEIVVASGDGEKWEMTQLTDDGVADVNPQIASSGDKAIVVWQRVGSSTDPTEFDLSNDIVYSCFDGNSWSEVRTAYSCCDGGIEGLDVAMTEDGTALISYCVNCTDGSDAEDDDNVEAFYSVVSADNAEEALATPVTRLSSNSKPDTTPHVAVVKDGGKQKFLMTWLEVEEYENKLKSGDDETKNNLRLALIDTEGKQDPGFVESIAANDNLTIDDSYILLTSEDQKLENTHVMWKVSVSETEDEEDNHIYDVLMASKFYVDGETEGLTAQQEVARLEDNVVIDHFDGYVTKEGRVEAVLFASDYNSPQADGAASIELQGLEEPVQATLTSPESQMYTAYCEVPERGFTISEPTYSLSEMEPGFESPLYFSFTNAGAVKLQSATITVDGTQSKTYTFANGGLLPGESVNLTFNYTLPTENIHDVEYEVTALTAEGTPEEAQWLDKENTNTLITINSPDVGISSFAVTSEGDAEREVTVGLKNDSNMPLEGSEKILKIAFYRDEEMTEQIGETQTIDSSYYGLIDNNVCTYRTTFTAEQLAELVKDDVTGQMELPSGEIRIYTKVWLLNPDKTAFTETMESNNTAYTSFTGLLDRYRDKALTEREDLMLSGISAREVEQGQDITTLADVTLQNLSLGTRTKQDGNQIGNVRIAAYDAKGSEIGTAETFDLSKPSKSDYKSVTTEGKLNVQPELKLTESYTAADIASWNVTLFEDSYQMLYTWDNVVDPEADKVEIPNSMFKATEMRTVDSYTYASREVDYGFTSSVSGEPTQGARKFVGWYEVLGYSDGTEEHLVGENGFTAEDLAKIDFIANPSYFRILAYEAYDFDTQLEKDTVLYALFTAMMVVDPDDTGTPLPADKTVSITGRTDNALTDENYITLELVGDTFSEALVPGVELPTNVDGIKVKVVEILPDNAKRNNVIRVQVFGEAPEGFTGNLIIRPTTKDRGYFKLGVPVSSIASDNLKIDIKAFFRVHHVLDGTEKETTVGYVTVGSTLKPENHQNSYTGYTYDSGTTDVAVQADKTSEITLNYKRNEYTIQYNRGSLATDPDTGKEVGVITGSTPDTKASYDKAVTLAECGFSYTGYTFTGWNTKADGTGVSYASGAQVLNLASSGEVTLYAQWVKNGEASYKVEYYFQTVTDGVADYVCDETKTEVIAGVQENTTVSVGAGSFDGYEFSAGNRLNVTEGEVSRNLTLRLYYDLPKVMVNFRATGAQGGTAAMYTPGTEVTVPGNETIRREGYTLKSWNTEADGTGETLVLTKKGYVKDSDGAFVLNKTTGQFEPASEQTEKLQHYTYTDVPNTFCAAESDTTYYAIWEKDSYTVTFDANADGDTVSFSNDAGYTRSGNTLVREVTYGEPILLPEVTRSASGASFLGWYDSTDPKTAKPATTETPSADVTYYAIWAKPYTVKHLYQDIASVGAAEIAWDESATVEETLWGEVGELTEAAIKPTVGFTAEAVTQQVIGSNTVVEIHYLRNSYHVQFRSNGGGLVGSEQVFVEGRLPYGAPLTAPELARAGYVFAGWGEPLPESVPAKNVVYTAQWVAKPCYVKGEISNLKSGTLVAELKRNDTVVASRTYEVTGAVQEVDFGICTEDIYQISATLYTAEGSCSMTDALEVDTEVGTEASSKTVEFTMEMPAVNQNAAIEVDHVSTMFGVSGMNDILKDNLNDNENAAMTLKIDGETDNKDLIAIRKLVSADGNSYALSFALTMNKHTQSLNLDGEVVAETDSQITDTNGRYLELAIPVGGVGLAVYRLHNGVVETVGSELSRRYENEPVPHEGWYSDTENAVLYLYVDKFSTFVIGRTRSAISMVTISKDISNGTVELLEKNGTEALLKVTADKGYALEQLSVTDASGKVYPTEKVDETTYRFALADVDVEVSASFKIRFKDVSEDAYYTDAVLWAYQNDITTGTDTEQTVFEPEGVTTRAQMVTFLWRAIGEQRAESEIDFTDVPENVYYTEAVRWAVAKGITTGTTETTFSPDEEVTRAQVVTFLYRYAEATPAEGTDSLFTDVPENYYFADAVRWAVCEGITNGTSETTFAPWDTCTRGQVVTFLRRFFKS